MVGGGRVLVVVVVEVWEGVVYFEVAVGRGLASNETMEERENEMRCKRGRSIGMGSGGKS